MKPDPALHSLEEDVRLELEAHLALAAEDELRRGCAPAEAERRARERFGDPIPVHAACVREKALERILMQRLLLVLVVLLTVAVGFLAAHTHAMRRDTERTLARLEDALLRSPGVALRGDDGLPAYIPTPRPIPSTEIVVQVGDVLELVELLHNKDLNGERVLVHEDGRVLLPHHGWLQVAGLNQPEVEALLQQTYEQYYSRVRLAVVIHGQD